MTNKFPVDAYSVKKKTKRRMPRLRYLLLPLIIIIASMFFLPDIRGGAEIFSERSSALSKNDLVRIDEDTIKRHNLTIDWDLQQFVARNAVKYKLYYGAIVIMDARTGDILALYGQKPAGQDCSLALNTDLAASIFKLVTAVAALDQAGMTSQSVFSYTGNAHTLYKNQLIGKRDRWTAEVSLADAFAYSNNVVFAKIGTHYLGETPLLLTAMKLGFWKSPLKECECTPSTIFFPQNDYNLAELSCGFNRKTRISPIHAAQMVTAVINNGGMVTPRLIRTADVEQTQVMSRDAAQNLGAMMERTVRTGTVAKRFRGTSSDRVLKHLTIGAKSGSIDGDDPAGRRNWFVGYAQDRNTGEAITIGCLLVRDDYFWIEADTLARLIIRHHFSKPLTVARNN
ncbi:MAG: penicillin-binding transpeptidase domain-containing protein [Syntrophaceae bacterium]